LFLALIGRVLAQTHIRLRQSCSIQYGEHYLDLEDFHKQMVHLLSKPHGVYSFFNGLAPDNLFFHGVACQCVKLQLSQVGLDSEFLPCEIQVKDEVWEGIRVCTTCMFDEFFCLCMLTA